MTNPNKKSDVVRGSELTLDMIFLATQSLPVTAAIMVGGKSYSQPDLLKAVEAARAPMKDTRTARKAYEAALEAERANEPAAAELIRLVRIGIKALLGDKNPKLKDFGFAVYHKPRELTVTEKALMVEKGRRTRERRHTLGPRAKEAVKGDDVSSVTLPRPSPVSPATPGSPGTSTAAPTSVPA